MVSKTCFETDVRPIYRLGLRSICKVLSDMNFYSMYLYILLKERSGKCLNHFSNVSSPSHYLKKTRLVLTNMFLFIVALPHISLSFSCLHLSVPF